MKYVQQSLHITAALFVSAFLPALAMASTAANTKITNNVSVAYTNTLNVPQTPVTASVDITVLLVAAAPIISDPADVDSTENTGVSLVYTITATANGPDTYTFGSTDTPTNMNASAGSTSPNILLGGTTIAAATAVNDTFITVPFDGVSDDVVNGIEEGDTVVIGGNAYVVDTIDESTVTNNTVQIPLTTLISSVVAIGEVVGERDTVSVTVTTDSITSGTSGTHSIATIATSSAPALEASATSTTLITVKRPLLTVTKYVRNETTDVVGTGDYDFDGETWYTSGVTGKTDDVMEYLIIVDNTDAAASQANNIVISDPIPQFTTFDATFSVKLDTDGTAANLAGFASLDETADDGDAAELDSTGNGTIYVYAGVGGDDTPAGASVGTGGNLAQGKISRVIFRVTID